MNNLDNFLDKKNVIGYSEDVKKRLREGKEVDEEVIRFYVSKKEDTTTLSKKDKLPDKINGIKTDVVELGEVEAYKSHRDKWKNMVGGISIGHENSTAGSLGIVTHNQDGQRVILSNCHVLALSGRAEIGSSIHQPGPYDMAPKPSTKVGELLDFVEIKFDGTANYQDSAVATISNTIPAKPLCIDLIGNIRGIEKATDNMQIQTSGRTQPDFSEGRVVDTKGAVDVNYGNGKSAFFKDLIITTPVADPGDSGSLVVSLNNKFVGLLFAGSSRSSVLNKPKYIIKKYGLDFSGQYIGKETARISTHMERQGDIPKGNLEFKILDKDDNPIVGVSCWIHKGTSEFQKRTDENGKVLFEDIPIQHWLYSISKDGYQDVTGTIKPGDFK